MPEALSGGTGRVTDSLQQGTAGGLLDGLAGNLSDVQGEGTTGSPYPLFPTLPSAGALPGLPPLTSLPWLPLPLPLPAPVTDGPETGSPDGTAPGDEEEEEDGEAGDASATGTPERTAHSRHLPAAPAPTLTNRASAPRHAPDAHAAPSAPLRQNPAGEPDGMLGHRAATDGGGSRYGDALALTPVHGAPLVLAPGAAARVEADETRDRYRDIPVSPA
ncbi:MAG TPA: hypothetical protein VFP69_05100 [Streptomyces sp.]|nr:hypothetical protein [Streptomyces sp.]